MLNARYTNITSNNLCALISMHVSNIVSHCLYTYICILWLYGWSDLVRWCRDCQLRREQGKFLKQLKNINIIIYSLDDTREFSTIDQQN